MRTKTRVVARCGLACACVTPNLVWGASISVEALEDDTKLVVRFNAVGQKTLRARFARLEPA